MSTESKFYGTGRRKVANARVWLTPGTGKFTVFNNSTNGEIKDLDGYFGKETLKMVIMQPFEATGTVGKFDVYANCQGGGASGQAGAIRHGISRALLEFNTELRATLKRGGFLTRDPRAKERKKYGRKKARKSFQFSKR